MSFNVYLSGEIHTDWREEIQRGAEAAGLDVVFTAPVTDHDASDAATTWERRPPGSGATTSRRRSTPSAPAR